MKHFKKQRVILRDLAITVCLTQFRNELILYSLLSSDKISILRLEVGID